MNIRTQLEITTQAEENRSTLWVNVSTKGIQICTGTTAERKPSGMAFTSFDAIEWEELDTLRAMTQESKLQGGDKK